MKSIIIGQEKSHFGSDNETSLRGTFKKRQDRPYNSTTASYFLKIQVGGARLES